MAFGIATEQDSAPANGTEAVEERGETAGQTGRGPQRGTRLPENLTRGRGPRTGSMSREVQNGGGAPIVRVGGPSVIGPVDGE